MKKLLIVLIGLLSWSSEKLWATDQYLFLPTSYNYSANPYIQLVDDNTGEILSPVSAITSLPVLGSFYYIDVSAYISFSGLNNGTPFSFANSVLNAGGSDGIDVLMSPDIQAGSSYRNVIGLDCTDVGNPLFNNAGGQFANGQSFYVNQLLVSSDFLNGTSAVYQVPEPSNGVFFLLVLTLVLFIRVCPILSMRLWRFLSVPPRYAWSSYGLSGRCRLMMMAKGTPLIVLRRGGSRGQDI